MNIFVTGGAGYIGSAAAQILLQAGHQVTVYDSLVNGHHSAMPAQATFVQADLADLADFELRSPPSDMTPSCTSLRSSRPAKACTILANTSRTTWLVLGVDRCLCPGRRAAVRILLLCGRLRLQ